MDLRKLKAFLLVAKHGSLRAAANQARQTIPAISIQIKKLEEELGVQLFHRLPNKLILTDRGEVFRREVNTVFESLERATASVSSPAQGFRGTLSISLGTDVAKFFAPRIAEFVKQHSDLNVMMYLGSSGRSLARVVDGEVDISFGFYRTVPRGVRKIKITETGISLLCPSGHPLRKRKDISLEDIAGYKVMMLPRTSATRRAMNAVFARNHVALRNVIEVGSCRTAIEFVQLGLGVALVHSICAGADAHPKLSQVDMADHFGRTDVAMIVRPDKLASPAHKAFVGMFVDGAP
jgi:DNA-binding transcriptional LysR family regulator